MGGGAQQAHTFLNRILLRNLPIQYTIKPPCKFLFFALFSHGRGLFSEKGIFRVLFQFATYSCGGGAPKAPTIFWPLLVELRGQGAGYIGGKGRWGGGRWNFLIKCTFMLVFVIFWILNFFEIRFLNAFDHDLTSSKRSFPSFLTHFLRLFKKTFLTKSSYFLLIKWLVKKNFQKCFKNALLRVGACEAPPQQE